MTNIEQLIDALESVERYLRNQDLSEIGMQVKGKVLEALQKASPLAQPTPHRCPVCEGSCIVPSGFYTGTALLTSIINEPCRSCDNGIIWK